MEWVFGMVKVTVADMSREWGLLEGKSECSSEGVELSGLERVPLLP